MARLADVEAEVWRALKSTVSPRLMRSGASRQTRLREDLNVGSLALVSIAMELCERFGVDAATLDLDSFIQRAHSVADLIAIAEDVLRSKGG